MAYSVYILKSLRDGTYYFGSTRNLEKRLKEHNAGKSKYTKGHRPFVIHYVEELGSRTEALKREAFLKSIQGYSWLRARLIVQNDTAGLHGQTVSR